MKIHAGEAACALLYIFLPLILGFIHAKATKKDKVALILNYYVFIGVGIQGLVTGIIQMAAPQIIVFFTGWPYSLFILELGMANAAFGVVGLISIWLSRGWKYAAGMGYALFLFFTGVGHLVDIYLNGPTPGSAGAFLFSDLLDPIAIWIFMTLEWKQKRRQNEEALLLKRHAKSVFPER